MAVYLGGTSNDILVGSNLSDILDGGAGADTMSGGNGNDTYIVDNAGDVVIESVGTQVAGNIDTVLASVSYTLGANVENLTLTGAANLNATGNELNNVLTSNTGINVLTGGAGNDTYVVNNTADTVVELGGQGTDSVQSSVTYTLAANVENLTLTGAAAINGTGNALDNVLVGNAGANVLTGGAGNDTYVVSSLADMVVELAGAGEGTDLVKSSVSYTLGANMENLTLTGSTAISGFGNALNNTLTGNSKANTLDGGAGVDTMSGGDGNDTYIVDNAGDVVIESAGTQVTGNMDSVLSSSNFTLGANVESLTLTGSANINATGNELNNVLTSNTGINVLTGGAGNDTYVVNNTADTVVELGGQGTDSVQSSVTYTLAANVENLTLTGAAAINGTGNALDNVLVGNAGANVLTGGAGNDTYVVNSLADTVVELAGAGEGTDLVQSSINYALGANVENLTLTGSTAISGFGNDLNNTLAGNSKANTIDGGAGVDTMSGGDGNDTYIVDNAGDVVIESAGTQVAGNIDSVLSSADFTLGANVENLTLTGSANINGSGNAQSNTLVGNTGANVLTGGAGADTITGGSGSDTFVMSNAGAADKLTDFVSGTDTLAVSMAGISVGNGDTVIDGAFTQVALGGAGGFSAASELVVFDYNITSAIDSTSAANTIGSAASAYGIGDTCLFAVDNGAQSSVYLFTSNGADALVSANELTLLCSMSSTAATTLADYAFLA